MSNINRNTYEKKKPFVKWTVEDSQKIDSIGREPITIERTLKPDSDGVRSISILRGRSRVNFDIQAAHIVALVIKQLSLDYVPEALTEESIIRDNEEHNVSESV